MSAAKKKTTSDHSWELTGSWAGAWKVFAGIGGLGLAGAALGYTQDHKRFAFSWLFAFVACLAVALGSIFFVLIQRLTSAGWSITVRRTAEFFAYGIIALIPLFAPILLCMNDLFPWLQSHGAEHGSPPSHVVGSLSLIPEAHAQTAPAAAAAPHGEPADPHAAAAAAAPIEREGADHAGEPAPGTERHAEPHAAKPGHGVFGRMPGHGPAGSANAGHGGHGGGRDPHALIHAEILAKKSAYLNKPFFLIRAAIYFMVWAFLAIRLFGYSAAQDKSKDPELTLAAQRFAPVGTFLFGITLTFASFDWIMSLEPTWFSTIFGVIYFASGAVSSYAVIILTTMALRKSGPLDGAVTVEHYHDLGKLMFGFTAFWAYVSFSQYMLIWYASVPEETTFFHHRLSHEPWINLTYAVVFGHFVIPFFWLMSRTFKRNLGRLQIGAVILLVMHVANMYWYVMPNIMLGHDGTYLVGKEFGFSWIDAACLLAVAGCYGAFVFHRMTQYSLVPVGDPRLARALHFQNA